MLAIELTDAWRRVLIGGGRMVLIIVLAWILNRLARRAITRLATRVRRAADDVILRAPGVLHRGDNAQRSEARASTLSSMLRSIATVVIFATALLMILGELRVSLGPLVAGAGIASIAVGFGAQSIVRDVLAGMFVLLEDQYGVGDIIDAGPATGTVEHVSLRSTSLRDLAGTVWHIPNGAIVRVGNKSQNWARAVIDVVVAHDTDIRSARAVMKATADFLATEQDWAEQRLAGEINDQGVQAVGPEGITLRLVIDTEPASQWIVERELRQRIKEAFDAEGIRLSTFVMAPAPAPPAEGPPPA